MTIERIKTSAMLCKSCKAKISKALKEKRLAKIKEWKGKNKEKSAASTKKYYEKNKEKIAEKKREWRAKKIFAEKFKQFLDKECKNRKI